MCAWSSMLECLSLPLANAPIFSSDPSPFSLSAEQRAIFAGWRRPAELVEGKEGEKGREGILKQLMTAREEMDFAQDLTTDCSVVASLCGAARHFASAKGSVSSLLQHFLSTHQYRLTCAETAARIADVPL